MAKRGAQPGNTNAQRGRIWSDAIRKVVKQSDKRSLEKLAMVLLDKAATGDMGALRELGDRLEGKAQSSVSNASDQPFVVQVKW